MAWETNTPIEEVLEWPKSKFEYWVAFFQVKNDKEEAAIRRARIRNG